MIDREKIITALECCKDVHQSGRWASGCISCGYADKHRPDCFLRLADDAVELLKEQEPEGKWIYGEDETGVDGWYCSECNFFEPWFYEFTEDIDFIRFYGHCPKCGRRMTSYTGKPTQERR